MNNTNLQAIAVQTALLLVISVTEILSWLVVVGSAATSVTLLIISYTLCGFMLTVAEQWMTNVFSINLSELGNSSGLQADVTMYTACLCSIQPSLIRKPSHNLLFLVDN